MTDVDKYIEELKNFDNNFDKLFKNLKAEIFDMKITVNKEIIKEIWNTAIEASAKIAEMNMTTSVKIRELKI